MFRIDNEKIGTFVSGLIEGKFKSARKFCIEYLRASGREKPTDEEIKNMSNRLSQINSL